MKAAIVTGSSRGIGRVIAEQLAADGFAVAVNYAARRADADEVVGSIEKAGGRAIAVQADVSDPSQVAHLFEQTRSAFGRVDAVVQNAGIMPLFSIAEGTIEAFDKVVAINLRGTFLVLSQAARHVEEGGRIIALSSSVIGRSPPRYGAYIATKAGVEGLVRVLANELRGRNITVNAVAPGPTATDLFLNGKDEAEVDRLRKLSPLERLGQPQDIADVVSFLAGPKGGWINGQIVRANGGFV